MKNLMKLLLAVLVSTGVAIAGTPVEVLVPVDHVYAPKGFDSNDNTEVVVSGYLPNLCHKSPMTEVKVNGKSIDINVKALKYDPTNPFCPEVIVPFVESINVGMLDKGLYDIKVNGKSIYEKNSKIEVAEATSDAVDDFVYANVEYVEKAFGSRVVKLKGYNPSDCFVLKDIAYVSNEKDTFSVLPKMEQVSDFCPMKMVPFTYETEVPKSLKQDTVLLHVRVMDGKSVNSLFDNTVER